MMYLYVQAPFAAFRTFTAGWYRPTAMFMTHSAAYGLLLNLGGIESRLREGEADHDNKTPATLTRSGLPACEIALGVPCTDESGKAILPRLQSVYQQLHNYPVGATGKNRAEECKGNKYNIAPVRREFISALKVVIAFRTVGTLDLENRVRSGLRAEAASPRYGLPFLGDNAFLPDRISEVLSPADIKWFVEENEISHQVSCQSVSWYEKLGTETNQANPGATRLTIQIDRADLSKSVSALFAPSEGRSANQSPPDSAWVAIRSLETLVPAGKRKK